jgi:hypothetical protein
MGLNSFSVGSGDVALSPWCRFPFREDEKVGGEVIYSDLDIRSTSSGFITTIPGLARDETLSPAGVNSSGIRRLRCSLISRTQSHKSFNVTKRSSGEASLFPVDLVC